MSESRTGLRPASTTEGARRIVLGVLAGAALLAISMILLAAAAIGLGWIHPAQAGRIRLEPWLRLELVGGALAGLASGALCRRIAGRYRGAAALAALVFVLGMVEAVAVIQLGAAAGADAPAGLALLAPLVGAAAVLAGGMRPGPGGDRPSLRRTGWPRYALPALVLAGAAILARFALPGLAGESEARILASALTLDLTVSVPALIYVLLVRTRRAPWIAVVPAFLVGYAIALAVIPAGHRGLLETMGFAVIPAELTVIAYLVVVTRRTLRQEPGSEGDFVTRFRSTARRVVGSRVPADILTTEVALLYHAFRWRRAPAPRENEFTVHREVGYASVLVGLVLLLVVESVALHALVSQWGAALTWILTGLSLYAIVWLIGDYRAMSARPTRLTPTHLVVRVGLRWDAEVPLGDIVAAEPWVPEDGPRGHDILAAALLGQPNLRLRLRGPVEVAGLYGIRRSVREIRLRVDGAHRLCELLGRPVVTGAANG